ncbi:MAG TPA: carboxypeptidase-like regulatory domain-containing protein [Pyrinomonadaceae bacterium]|nr:carboxypeptidase-like regulatory domain-containing protein [Pyrinomonadaceae bacterium]
MRRHLISFGIVVISLCFAVAADAQIDIRGEINGRVMTDDKRPARRVSILVMDLTTLDQRNVITNDFGCFRIRDLQFGNTFLIGAKSKSYDFAFPFQTVRLDLISREVLFIANRPQAIATVAAIDEPVIIISKAP